MLLQQRQQQVDKSSLILSWRGACRHAGESCSLQDSAVGRTIARQVLLLFLVLGAGLKNLHSRVERCAALVHTGLLWTQRNLPKKLSLLSLPGPVECHQC